MNKTLHYGKNQRKMNQCGNQNLAKDDQDGT